MIQIASSEDTFSTPYCSRLVCTPQTKAAIEYATPFMIGTALLLTVAAIWLYRHRRYPELATPPWGSVLAGCLTLLVVGITMFFRIYL
jgi:uncharacterized membrane protein